MMQGLCELKSLAEPTPGRFGKLQLIWPTFGDEGATGKQDAGPVDETNETAAAVHVRLAAGFVSELWS
ncbi:MAG: hypothetical protein AUH17_08185 [Actinobacteria bacterium 13_2_20CM_68_14]|nr:MAG: hypothetical protein AUH17_08185 [Actinobacteria bacterium 13_2_20CM_68_14]OLE19605.1 MAG: hypothetical protein AUG88_00485 [Actinobacteria bacterium 13_1_20CM_4_68_12]